MRSRNLPLFVIAAAAAILLIGCGGAEQSQSETPAASNQTPSETTQAAQTYPLDYCIVSGEKLGSMGEPVTYNYKGRQIKFCCNGCVKTFEDNPEMYIAKLDSAAAGLMQMPGHDMPMEGHEAHGHGG